MPNQLIERLWFMASPLTNMVPLDIFHFTAFKLPFLSICQAWAHSFTSQRRFPVKVKGKTLIDFSSVIASLKFVRVLSPVSAQWMGMCLKLDFGVTTGGNLWICGCSLDLKLWFPCSLNHPHWGAWISSCLSKSPLCQRHHCGDLLEPSLSRQLLGQGH